jgi:hypothetical protein
VEQKISLPLAALVVLFTTASAPSANAPSSHVFFGAGPQHLGGTLAVNDSMG